MLEVSLSYCTSSLLLIRNLRTREIPTFEPRKNQNVEKNYVSNVVQEKEMKEEKEILEEKESLSWKLS